MENQIYDKLISDTYIIHSFQLLPADGGSIVEHQRRVRREARHVAQPDLEEAYLDEYELIVLA